MPRSCRAASTAAGSCVAQLQRSRRRRRAAGRRRAGRGRPPRPAAAGADAARRPASRAVSDGSSASTVPVPTMIASASARRRCTSARAASPVIHWLVPSAAAHPPVEARAHFKVTYGRPRRRRVSQSRELARPRPRAPRSSTSTPAARRTRRRRRRAGWGRRRRARPGRRPAVDQRLGQGPVRPVWLQGSRVTTAVPPRAALAGLGQRVDLGVRGAGAAVPAGADDGARRRPASTQPTRGLGPRTGPRMGELAAASPHRLTSARCGPSSRACRLQGVPPIRSCSCAGSGGIGAATHGDDLVRRPRRRVEDADAGRRRCACCLPSGLSPSVLEFHQVNRPLAAVGSRTVTAGSELHRPRSTHCPTSMRGRPWPLVKRPLRVRCQHPTGGAGPRAPPVGCRSWPAHHNLQTCRGSRGVSPGSGELVMIHIEGGRDGPVTWSDGRAGEPAVGRWSVTPAAAVPPSDAAPRAPLDTSSGTSLDALPDPSLDALRDAPLDGARRPLPRDRRPAAPTTCPRRR